MKYFDLYDDKHVPERWYLGAPTDEQGREINPWQFMEGRHLDLPQKLHLPVYEPGRALDFDQAAFGIPVVHARVVEVMHRLSIPDVQFLPVHIPAQPEPYFILNATRVVRCIDDARCREVAYWRPEDGQPAKVGTYRAVHGLRIDPEKVGDVRLFRPWGWPIALIASEDIQRAFAQERILGTRFVEV